MLRRKIASQHQSHAKNVTQQQTLNRGRQRPKSPPSQTIWVLRVSRGSGRYSTKSDDDGVPYDFPF